MNEVKESNNKVNKVLLSLVFLLIVVLIVIICYFVFNKKEENKTEVSSSSNVVSSSSSSNIVSSSSNTVSSSSSTIVTSSEEIIDMKATVKNEVLNELNKIKSGNKSTYSDINSLCSVSGYDCKKIKSISVNDVSLYKTSNGTTQYTVTVKYLCNGNKCIYTPQCDSCGEGSEDQFMLLAYVDKNNKITKVESVSALE